MPKAGSKLVIVESPAKAKTIERYLGSEYKVVASMGHLRDLPKSKLGVDIENNFEPHYIPVKGRLRRNLHRGPSSLSRIQRAFPVPYTFPSSWRLPRRTSNR